MPFFAHPALFSLDFYWFLFLLELWSSSGGFAVNVTVTVAGVINSNARVGSTSAMVDVVRVMFLGKLRRGTALAFAIDSRPKAMPASAGEWLLVLGKARCEHRIECHG